MDVYIEKLVLGGGCGRIFEGEDLDDGCRFKCDLLLINAGEIWKEILEKAILLDNCFVVVVGWN